MVIIWLRVTCFYQIVKKVGERDHSPAQQFNSSRQVEKSCLFYSDVGRTDELATMATVCVFV